jgi:hypothetical protein
VAHSLGSGGAELVRGFLAGLDRYAWAVSLSRARPKHFGVDNGLTFADVDRGWREPLRHHRPLHQSRF